jgi:hypothetical protein
MLRATTLFFYLLTITSFGQNVKVKNLKDTDFTQFETFAVSKGDFTVQKEERRISEDKFYELLKNFVKQELELKGYHFTDDTLAADFIVDYVAGAFSVTESENLGPLGGTPAVNPTMQDQSRYWSDSYREGLLVMDIYKGNHDNVLWTAETTVDLSNINTERALASVIAKSFKKFPKKKVPKKK